MYHYKNEKIVIIGLGITGLSCINFFLSKNIIPKVIDTRSYVSNLSKVPRYVPCHLGSWNKEWLYRATLIVVSPGVYISHVKSIINEGKNVMPKKIINDIEIFSCETNLPVIAITGSNGKSTVTKLVETIITQSGLKVGVGGNIGFPVLQLLNRPVDLYLLELSSFQLEAVYSLRTKISTILNVTEDHMDRYLYGFWEYYANKQKIYNHADICVINAKDPLTFPRNYKDKHCIIFNDNKKNYSIIKDNSEIWISAFGKKILNCKHLLVRGEHNYINILSALAIADAIEIPRPYSLKAICKFRGLRHRCELISRHRGIFWINDSKSTTVDSTLMAVFSINTPGYIHLLLGGDGKNANFYFLYPLLKNRKIRIYCFGKDGEKIRSIFPNISIFVNTLEQAMSIVNKYAKNGDVVLLSPACSSLDQFKNFKARGVLFEDLSKYKILI